MKRILKKFTSVLLMLCLLLALMPSFAEPAFAADANSVADTINAVEGLKADITEPGTVVTVTNTTPGATVTLGSPLSIAIPVGVKVVWKASATSTTNTLISLSDEGTFEVADGAYLSASTNSVISTQQTPIIVSGGIVSCDSERTPFIDVAIDTASDITVSGGVVRNTKRGYAISINGSNVSVSVTGGIVESLRYGNAISCFNAAFRDVVIAVSGGRVSAGSGNAIIMVACSSSSITISGDAEIKTNGYFDSPADAIYTNIPVTVSGGTVSSAAGHAIKYGSTTDYSGTIFALTVSGGTVKSTTKAAIYFPTDSAGKLTVDGGMVFSYGNKISDVIVLPNATGAFTGPTENGVVMAWDQEEATKTTSYNNGDTVGASCFTVSPSATNVQWAKKDNQSGIAYSYDTTTGFIPIDGVNVEKPDVTTDHLNYTTSSSLNLTYSGNPQGIGEVTSKSGISLGAIKVYYSGEMVTNTNYDKSISPPTNVGSYIVTADVEESDYYSATNDIELFRYTIKKASAPALTWTTAANITYGQTLSSSALSGGSQEFGAFAWKDTTIVPNAGTHNFDVSFTPSASTILNYETITPTTSPVSITVVKATGDSVGTNCDVASNYAKNYSLDLTSLLPSNVATSQISSYALTYTSDKGIFSQAPSVSGSTLTLPIASVATAGQSETVTIAFESSNYEISDATVTVSVVNKTPVTITASIQGGVYNGDAYAYSNKVVALSSGGSIVTDAAVDASYRGINGTNYGPSKDAPTNAGIYQLTLSVPNDDASYTGSATFAFTIEKRPVTVRAEDKTTATGSIPDLTYILDGQLSGETALTSDPVPHCNWDTVSVGSYEITVNMMGASYTNNYKAASPASINGTLTVSNPSSANGSSSGGGSSAPVMAETSGTTVSGSTATTTVTTQTDSGGKVTASVTQSQVSDAIEAAREASKNIGQAPKVEIKISGEPNARTLETTLPKSAIQALVRGEMESLRLSSNVAAMTFDAESMAAIAGAASGDVAFTASQTDVSSLSKQARQLVGDRPVYNFSVISGGNTISQFNGTVTVALPYTPKAGEDTKAIVSYYINASGQAELMKNCYYDSLSGTLVFTTTHFSQYAVGYNKVSFGDVKNTAWYSDPINYLAAREITSGTSQSTFSPGATLTRGQFITLLMRAYGIDPDDNLEDNFKDAGNTYYTGYLAAAKRLEITSGVGDNKFAPKQAISRQDMFTLLYNALKEIDQLPKDKSGKSLSAFQDTSNISSYAEESMVYLVEAGTVGGNNGQLNPKDTTTRAQMAQVLYKLLSN